MKNEMIDSLVLADFGHAQRREKYSTPLGCCYEIGGVIGIFYDLFMTE
jgi:hypothetical protein